MDMMQHALAYAARGWAVFPVHTPQDGECSCHRKGCDRVGKHPRISTGRNGATTDSGLITRWWTTWPDANIGIATGKESGFIVLDVDMGGEDSIPEKIPDTVEQITGSGGRHALFKRPDTDGRFKTLVRFLDGLDSRADGGYIVAPPSLHASGDRYEWEASSHPDECPLADPPRWFVEAIEAPPIDDSANPAPQWNPDGELPENILEILSYIPANDYDMWRDVGMALHYTDPADGLEVWDWWSGTAANYSSDAVRREWRNFSRRGHAVANPVTLSTITRLAEQHGWTDPAIEHGAEVASRLLDSHQRRITEALHKSPVRPSRIDAPDMMPDGGLIHDIAQHILATSIRPQPRLAVAAATAFVATLAGRKYRTETGLMSNLYIAGLAQSGHGKDQARKVINKLATHANVGHYMGGDSIASGQAVISALSKNPSKLFMLDEFGKFLGALTGQKAAPHQRDIITKLMILYSSAGSVYRGTEYADQKERPREDIVNPNACLYGTSVPDNFWGAMSSAEGGDGTMSRLIVVEAESKRPFRNRPSLSDPAPDLICRIESLALHTVGGGNLAGRSGAGVDSPAQTVPMTDAVFDAWESLDDDMTANMTDGISASIYSRVAENAAKLAMVYAVSQDHHSPVIGANAFSWGRELALWSANTLMHNIGRNVADNNQEAAHKRVINIIRDSGQVTRRELLRKCRFLRKRELEEILELSIEAGDLVVENIKNERGPATTVYKAGE